MYDVVIVGGGLGGLLCADFLAKENLRVCVLEKNRQAGGNLQTFSRHKQLFDTGVHYIGGLEEGQTLNKIFTYAGLLPGLDIVRMESAFDKILIGADEQVYECHQGYESFSENLKKQFPAEAAAIDAYCALVQEACRAFPLYFLDNNGTAADKVKYTTQPAKAVIAGLTANERLQDVLAGNNLLYAGQGGKTPFHQHALIINSYIESSWKCTQGGSQITKMLVRQIRAHGGEVLRNAEVATLATGNGLVTHAETLDGRRIQGRQFIAAMHPAIAMRLVGSTLLRPVYRQRLLGLEQSAAYFSLYIIFKKETIPYENSNYYYHKEGCVWHLADYKKEDWPLGYGLYFTEDGQHRGYVAAASVLALMDYKEVEAWAHTCNTTAAPAARGSGYEALKAQYTQRLLQLLYTRFPHLEAAVEACYSATPLTARDYIGTPQGAMYGIQKDYKDPVKSTISPRTKIPNLFLTGQNMNLHGILGTSLSAILTCTILLGGDALIDKIKNA